VRSLRLRGRVFELMLANTGNVAETLDPSDLTLTIGRARLHPRRRQLLPHTRALFQLAWRGALRSRFVARVRVRRRSRTMVCDRRRPCG
jgi:hypothetical protein